MAAEHQTCEKDHAALLQHALSIARHRQDFLREVGFPRFLLPTLEFLGVWDFIELFLLFSEALSRTPRGLFSCPSLLSALCKIDTFSLPGTGSRLAESHRAAQEDGFETTSFGAKDTRRVGIR